MAWDTFAPVGVDGSFSSLDDDQVTVYTAPASTRAIIKQMQVRVSLASAAPEIDLLVAGRYLYNDNPTSGDIYNFCSANTVNAINIQDLVLMPGDTVVIRQPQGGQTMSGAYAFSVVEVTESA